MGYMLLYESMLGSVIRARDRWLRPGGLILPSNATLYMAPVTRPDRYTESIDFWRNVYGIDTKQCAFEEPSVETISGESVLTWPHVVKHVDCYTVSVEELESISTGFKFKSMMRAPFHGFAFWFDVEFNGLVALPSQSDASSTINASSNGHASDSTQRKKRPNPNGSYPRKGGANGRAYRSASSKFYHTKCIKSKSLCWQTMQCRNGRATLLEKKGF